MSRWIKMGIPRAARPARMAALVKRRPGIVLNGSPPFEVGDEGLIQWFVRPQALIINLELYALLLQTFAELADTVLILLPEVLQVHRDFFTGFTVLKDAVTFVGQVDFLGREDVKHEDLLVLTTELVE